ncbi:MAG: GDP-mannose 4,6-dehydratase [Chitinophagales bacterium]|jgi:nucleoside-diphosphate-sugar epimerase|nr:GDP-mannose 4,6-dehydratase [Chitinophagales bacterium]
MKVLITGIAGFIGSSLADFLLDQGCEVVGIDNFDDFYPKAIKEKNLKSIVNHLNAEFIEADILDISQALALVKQIDVVVHIAAKAGVRPSIENPDAYILNNILGTQRVLDFCVQRAIKSIVFASSSSIYGNQTLPFSESFKLDKPISPYAYTKISGELMMQTYHHLYQLNVICLRFFTVYGPRQRPDLAINKFISQITQDQPITLFGDGTTSRDYTFIADIVRGVFSAINLVLSDKPIFEAINLGSQNPIKLIDMVEELYRALQKKPQIEFLPMQSGDVDHTYSDIAKAKEILGYEPQVTFSEGIARFIAWHRSN